MSLVQIKNVKKYYNHHKKNQITAIDNTSLEFDNHGLITILGNSGCGKTTLLNMIGGLDKPNSGKIYLNGKVMNSFFSNTVDNLRNQYIGYIFQNYHLIDDMTVFDNVALPLRMLGVKKTDLKEPVLYALEKVGLYRYRHRPASALSGGERQRVGIARAIVKNPNIIIADEPTGNLDSGNTLEIMNIIKTISKQKLVILVTHEKNLAQFYSDRIIEIVDGRVVSDKINDNNENLDYRNENKLYLKDFIEHQQTSNDQLDLDYYSDNSAKAQVKIVLRNSNLYIECANLKVEVVDSDSAIEMVDDHYHALSQEESAKKDFDYSRFEKVNHNNRYHSIFSFTRLLASGFMKVFSYSRLKKVLLFFFIISSMFVLYSISNILGVNEVKETDFLKVNRDYLLYRNKTITISDYQNALKNPDINYVLLGDSKIYLNLSYDSLYYQSNGYTEPFNPSLAAIDVLSDDEIIYGRKAQNKHEVVIDTLILDSIINDGSSVMVGLDEYSEFVGITCVDNQKENYYQIVGVSNSNSPCLYALKDEMMDIIINQTSKWVYYDYDKEVAGPYYSDISNLEDYQKYIDQIKLTKGNYPKNDYEIIVPFEYSYDEHFALNKEVDSLRIEDHKLKVVGYYTIDNNVNFTFLSNHDTYVYSKLNLYNSLTIYPNDKEKVMSYYQQANLSIVDTYVFDKNNFIKERNNTVNAATIAALVILGISLVEIYLMLRSSFLSRIKEVGTLRAIGLKKYDVYKMFIGEILAITLITCPIGLFLMGNIIKKLAAIPYIGSSYYYSYLIYVIAVILIFSTNIFFGLLPVINTLRKTPAEILARTDVQ